MLLAQVQLGVGLTTILDKSTLPAPGLVNLATMWICNVTAATRQVTIRVGVGTLTIANSLFEQNQLPANDTWVIGSAGEIVACINAGMLMQGLCDSANGVTVTIFGDLKP